MTIEIKYDNKLYEVIKVANAYVSMVNLYNKTENVQLCCLEKNKLSL